MDFEPDQLMDVVPRREAFHGLGSVFIDATHEIVRHAKIERAVLLAGKEIDVIGHQAAVVMDSGLAASRRPGMTKERLRGDLLEERLRVDARMVVRQQIERHRGDLFQ